jgi:prepilin-type N-terminal cleavage/methylation domain-containing protein
MDRKLATDKRRGFSLIELLIVVAIILIIAAVAVPNLIRAKIAANQASAADSLRTLDSAATNYFNTYGDGYPPSLAVLGGAGPASCAAAEMIDPTLATGQKSGYVFNWVVGANKVANPPAGCLAGYIDMFSVTADPFGFPTGTTHYCVDASGVIRQSSAPIAATAAGCPSSALPIGN